MMGFDVVIVGGGVVGSSIAFHLAESGQRSVLVLERDPSYAQASSALSASSIRQQFTTPVCIDMSRYGFEFFRAIGQRLAVDGCSPQIGLVERGYLYLAKQGFESGLQAAVSIQLANDAPVVALSQRDLSERFAWLSTHDLSLGALGTAGEGWYDGYSVMQAFKTKARSLGVEYRHDCVIGFQMKGDRISSIATSGGKRIEADIVVNAAGPNAASIAAFAGVSLPLAPEKRTVFAFRCADPLEGVPLIVDPSGFWVRPEGDGYISGGPALHPVADPSDFEPDFAQFEDFLWPNLAHRIPAFERIKMTRAWAGHYEMNLFDHNAFIGWVPGVDNLMIAAGFSGHGMQHSPATGRGVAELIVHGAYESLDLSILSLDRLTRGEKIEELNVI